MRQPAYSGQFKRDVRLAQKRRYGIGKLKTLMSLLIAGEPLPAIYKDHPLTGEWNSFRDAHIEPDWLLIYKPGKTTDGGEAVRFERTGTHSDIFE